MSKPLSDALNRLAVSLTDATDAGDWQAVTRLDARVSELLAKSQPVPASARPALDTLRRAHGRALEQARLFLADLQSRIDHLGNNREGLRAYEQSGGPV